MFRLAAMVMAGTVRAAGCATGEMRAPEGSVGAVSTAGAVGNQWDLPHLYPNDAAWGEA